MLKIVRLRPPRSAGPRTGCAATRRRAPAVPPSCGLRRNCNPGRNCNPAIWGSWRPFPPRASSPPPAFRLQKHRSRWRSCRPRRGSGPPTGTCVGGFTHSLNRQTAASGNQPRRPPKRRAAERGESGQPHPECRAVLHRRSRSSGSLLKNSPGSRALEQFVPSLFYSRLRPHANPDLWLRLARAARRCRSALARHPALG